MDVGPGAHCDREDCRQRDFLPFRCVACKKTFCLDHRSFEGHMCTESHTLDRTALFCPICKAAVTVLPKEDPNDVLADHIDSGCKTAIPRVPTTKNRCSFSNCKQTELVPILCRSCKKNFCLKHRLEADHSCTNSATAVSSFDTLAPPRRMAQTKREMVRVESEMDADSGGCQASTCCTM